MKIFIILFICLEIVWSVPIENTNQNNEYDETSTEGTVEVSDEYIDIDGTIVNSSEEKYAMKAFSPAEGDMYIDLGDNSSDSKVIQEQERLTKIKR